MSYCRFSSDNWMSDVYCYEGEGGFVTHVAGNRVVGEIPQVPPLPGVPDEGIDKEKWFAPWLAAHRVQMAFLEDCGRKPIGLPHDGESFGDDDLPGLLARLLMLRAAGYHVPEDAIDAVRAEMEDEQ